MATLNQIPQGISGSPQAGASEGNAEDASKRAAEEQMRRDLLTTVLDTEARERCMSCFALGIVLYSLKEPLGTSMPSHMISCPVIVSRIALVSPERSRQVEAILLRMAQSGQLKGRVTESQLIDLLEQVSSRMHLLRCILYLRRLGR